MLEAFSFQAVFGSMLKFLVEWMTGQSLQLFPLDGSFVLMSVLQRLKVRSLFHLLDWCASHNMFYTLSSLLLLVFEAVSQVVEAYSTTGLTAPV